MILIKINQQKKLTTLKNKSSCIITLVNLEYFYNLQLANYKFQKNRITKK